jgi:hypothetical protein
MEPVARLVSLAFSVLVFSGSVGAQRFAELVENPRAPEPVGIAAALGDFDADRDLDIAVAELGVLRMYRNDGQARFSDVPGAFPAASFEASALAVGDVDRDGDLDVVLATARLRTSGQTRLYLNDGSGLFTDATAGNMPIDGEWTIALVLGDVDGDRDLDIVLSGFLECSGCLAPQTRLYRNDGTGRFFDAQWSLPPVFGVTSLALGDVDVDGDLDIVLGRASTVVAGHRLDAQDQLLLNDGAGVFANVTGRWMPVADVLTNSLAFGDVDRDGDLDLVVGHGGKPVPYVRVLHNTGTAFVDSSTFIPSSCNALALADLDRDGNLDLVLASAVPDDGRSLVDNLTVHRNDGSRFGRLSVAGLDGIIDEQSARRLAVGDLDGDGDLDVVTVNYRGPVRILLGDGTGRLLDARTPRVPAYFGFAAAFDADGDEVQDLVTTQFPGANWYLHNDGQGGFRVAASAWQRIPWYATRGAAAGDVDGDGDADLLFANWPAPQFQISGANELLENDGKGAFQRTAGVPPDPERTYAVVFADVDVDGDLDFVAANFDVPSRVYVNDGSGVFSNAPSSFANPARDAAFGDVDADGDPDLVLAIFDGQSRLYLNDGRGGFADATAGRLPALALATNTAALVDVDGDRDLDLVLGNEGQNKLYRNDGRGFFADDAVALPVLAEKTMRLVAGDLDEDGDVDLALATSDRAFAYRVYRNDATGRYVDVSATVLPPNEPPLYPVLALFDVDDDGDLDLLTETKLYVNLHRQLHVREPARPGFTTRVELSAQPGYASGFQVVLPFASTSRSTPALSIPRLGRLRLDPTDLFVLPPVLVPPPGGTAALDVAVPGVPALRGLPMYVQAVVLHTFQPHDARFTGALRVPIH